jgi:hypothetical protein
MKKIQTILGTCMVLLVAGVVFAGMWIRKNGY